VYPVFFPHVASGEIFNVGVDEVLLEVRVARVVSVFDRVEDELIAFEELEEAAKELEPEEVREEELKLELIEEPTVFEFIDAEDDIVLLEMLALNEVDVISRDDDRLDDAALLLLSDGGADPALLGEEEATFEILAEIEAVGVAVTVRVVVAGSNTIAVVGSAISKTRFVMVCVEVV
jgi:hypothetical protein